MLFFIVMEIRSLVCSCHFTHCPPSFIQDVVGFFPIVGYEISAPRDDNGKVDEFFQLSATRRQQQLKAEMMLLTANKQWEILDLCAVRKGLDDATYSATTSNDPARQHDVEWEKKNMRNINICNFLLN